jgi:hypothetical protein
LLNRVIVDQRVVYVDEEDDRISQRHLAPATQLPLKSPCAHAMPKANLGPVCLHIRISKPLSTSAILLVKVPIAQAEARTHLVARPAATKDFFICRGNHLEVQTFSSYGAAAAAAGA